ncbi:MAG: hypothetical protein N2489_04610 [Clostridia bacterium]|nr:hypothetical protein [Clostridia bacterium]
MNEDLGSKLNLIAELLGQDKIPDELINLLSALISSSSAKGDSSPYNERATESASENNAGLNDIKRLRQVIDGLNMDDDPGINLINAIEPFLNSTRQRKLSRCTRLLQLIQLARLMEDSDRSSETQGR